VAAFIAICSALRSWASTLAKIMSLLSVFQKAWLNLSIWKSLQTFRIFT
jgi:hypothetical protein